MKVAVILIKTVLITVLVAIPVMAHKPRSKSTHADIANQQACYQQSKAYVEDKQREWPAKDRNEWSGDTGYYFKQAHYDSISKTCYVDYERRQTYRSTEEYSMMFIENVDDAFEGKNIASFIGQTKREEPAGREFVDQPPTTCQVNRTKCHSRPQFNGLLWDMIPPFTPVNAKVVPSKRNTYIP